MHEQNRGKDGASLMLELNWYEANVLFEVQEEIELQEAELAYQRRLRARAQAHLAENEFDKQGDEMLIEEQRQRDLRLQARLAQLNEEQRAHLEEVMESSATLEEKAEYITYFLAVNTKEV